MPKGPDKVSPYSKASATEHTATYWEANPRLWERPLLRVRYGQIPKAADHLRGPSRLAMKKQRLYWHLLHPAPGGRRDPGRASQHTMARIRPRAFPFCQLSVMDNFQSGELLVGNQPRKTKPEKRIDPRLVGYRFVTSLPSTRKKWAIRGGKKTIPGAVYVPLGGANLAVHGSKRACFDPPHRSRR